MEELAIRPVDQRPELLDELALLADVTRVRIMAVLTRHELTVAELCDVLALPQSTVSRHLRLVLDAGWVVVRPDGARRYHRAAVDERDDPSRRLWALVAEQVATLPAAAEDGRRLDEVLERRATASLAFFRSAAAEWDALRAEMFGGSVDARLLPALLPPGAAVADLGCGGGHLAAALAPYAARVVGVDGSREMLSVAAARCAAAGNVELVEGQLEALPIADGSLDVALSILVLHRVAEPAAALAEAARVLRPGGRLILSDMLPHAHEEYRRSLGHVWLGFDRAHVAALLDDAGLLLERHVELPPEPGARGPGLFVATARRDHRTTP